MQLMEGTALSFSLSSLRTVTLTLTCSSTAATTMSIHTMGNTTDPTGQHVTASGDVATGRTTVHPTVTAWQLWTESSWPLLLNIEGLGDKPAEAAVGFSEELIDHGFHPRVAPQFATYAGLTFPPAEMRPCLATYRGRNNLIPASSLDT